MTIHAKKSSCASALNNYLCFVNLLLWAIPTRTV